MGLWHSHLHWSRSLCLCSQADTHKSMHSSGPCTCLHAGRGWSHIHQCPVHIVYLEMTQSLMTSHTDSKILITSSCFNSELTTIARNTSADELVNAILTCSSIFTWITSTLIHITEAACIVVTTWAFTLEAIHKVHANTTICTGIAGTFIDIGFTVLASESRNTITRVPGWHTHKIIMKAQNFTLKMYINSTAAACSKYSKINLSGTNKTSAT